MKPAKHALRTIRESAFYNLVTSNSLYREAVLRGDQLIGRVVRSTQRAAPRSAVGHVLIAPTGGGNIGDQALVESFLQSVNGRITILVSSANAIHVPDEHLHRVTIHSVRSFIYLPPFFRALAAFRFSNMIQSCDSVSVLGADLMDGLYNPGASLARVSALCMARSFGRPAILVGCSWSDKARSTSVVAMRRAAELGAVINARDPISANRMTRDGIKNVQQTADIVFALSGFSINDDARLAVDYGRAQGRQIAVVNMSGLIGKRYDQLAEYKYIILDLVRRNFHVILLPHVFRATGDDLWESERLLRQLTMDAVCLLKEQLKPQEVKWLVANSEIVITGRMHLAVMSLASRTPVITLGSHGKVEGLYQYFPWLHGYVDPIPGFGKEVVARLDRVLSQHGDWDKSLDDVSKLAELNVVPLER